MKPNGVETEYENYCYRFVIFTTSIWCWKALISCMSDCLSGQNMPNFSFKCPYHDLIMHFNLFFRKINYLFNILFPSKDTLIDLSNQIFQMRLDIFPECLQKNVQSITKRLFRKYFILNWSNVEIFPCLVIRDVSCWRWNFQFDWFVKRVLSCYRSWQYATLNTKSFSIYVCVLVPVKPQLHSLVTNFHKTRWFAHIMKRKRNFMKKYC